MNTIFRHSKFVALLLCLCLKPGFSHAQLNVGPQFVLPVEGFGDHIQWGFGAGILMEVPVIKPVSFVGHFDYIHWMIDKTQDENLRLNTVAYQAGIRLYPSRKIYIQGWGGGFQIYAATKIYGIETSGSDSEYGWAIGAGFLPNRRTDLNLRLQSMGSLRFLALRLDHRFGVRKEKEQAAKQ